MGRIIICTTSIVSCSAPAPSLPISSPSASTWTSLLSLCHNPSTIYLHTPIPPLTSLPSFYYSTQTLNSKAEKKILLVNSTTRLLVLVRNSSFDIPFPPPVPPHPLRLVPITSLYLPHHPHWSPPTCDPPSPPPSSTEDSSDLKTLIARSANKNSPCTGDSKRFPTPRGQLPLIHRSIGSIRLKNSKHSALGNSYKPTKFWDHLFLRGARPSPPSSDLHSLTAGLNRLWRRFQHSPTYRVATAAGERSYHLADQGCWWRVERLVLDLFLVFDQNGNGRYNQAVVRRPINAYSSILSISGGDLD